MTNQWLPVVQSGEGQYRGRERKMVIMGLFEIRYVKLLKSVKHDRIEKNLPFSTKVSENKKLTIQIKNLKN